MSLPAADLFQGLVFYLDPELAHETAAGEEGGEEDIQTIEAAVTAHGGDVVAVFDPNSVTHLVCHNSNEGSTACQLYEEHKERWRTTVVSDTWVTACAQQGRLVPATCKDELTPNPKFRLDSARHVFSGLVACFSQFADTEELSVVRDRFVEYGGRVRIDIDDECTHLILGQLKGRMLRFALDQDQCPFEVVHPSWVNDSIASQRCADVGPYNPTYAIVCSDPSGSTIPDRAVALKRFPRGALLAGQSFCFKGLGAEEEASLKEKLEEMGAAQAAEAWRATVVIAYHRDTDEPHSTWSRRVSAPGLKVMHRTPVWVEDCHLYRTMEFGNEIQMWKGLLYTPLPTTPISESGDIQVAYTGYHGHYRTLIQQLVVRTGAKWSNSMTRGSDTHLLCKEHTGDKHEAAKKWGISVVSHLWLLDSIIMWKWQDVGKYCAPGQEEMMNRRWTGLSAQEILDGGMVCSESLLPNEPSQNEEVDASQVPDSPAQSSLANGMVASRVITRDTDATVGQGEVPALPVASGETKGGGGDSPNLSNGPNLGGGGGADEEMEPTKLSEGPAEGSGAKGAGGGMGASPRGQEAQLSMGPQSPSPGGAAGEGGSADVGDDEGGTGGGMEDVRTDLGGVFGSVDKEGKGGVAKPSGEKEKGGVNGEEEADNRKGVSGGDAGKDVQEVGDEEMDDEDGGAVLEEKNEKRHKDDQQEVRKGKQGASADLGVEERSGGDQVGGAEAMGEGVVVQEGGGGRGRGRAASGGGSKSKSKTNSKSSSSSKDTDKENMSNEKKKGEDASSKQLGVAADKMKQPQSDQEAQSNSPPVRRSSARAGKAGPSTPGTGTVPPSNDRATNTGGKNQDLASPPEAASKARGRGRPRKSMGEAERKEEEVMQENDTAEGEREWGGEVGGKRTRSNSESGEGGVWGGRGRRQSRRGGDVVGDDKGCDYQGRKDKETPEQGRAPTKAATATKMGGAGIQGDKLAPGQGVESDDSAPVSTAQARKVGKSAALDATPLHQEAPKQSGRGDRSRKDPGQQGDGEGEEEGGGEGERVRERGRAGAGEVDRDSSPECGEAPKVTSAASAFSRTKLQATERRRSPPPKSRAKPKGAQVEAESRAATSSSSAGRRASPSSPTMASSVASRAGGTGAGGQRLVMVCGSVTTRDMLTKAIGKLGAKSAYTHSWDPDATHILCRELKRTEKLLCGLAAGRWFLKEDYVIESEKSGRWLNEASFEWHHPRTTESRVWNGTARRWREYRSSKGHGPFLGQHFLILPGTNPPPATLSQIIISGSGQATIVGGGGGIPMPSPKAAAEVVKSRGITHVLVPEDNTGEDSLSTSFATACMVLRASYILDLLCERNSPDPTNSLYSVVKVARGVGKTKGRGGGEVKEEKKNAGKRQRRS